MGNVLIIKNHSKTSDIYKYASKSFVDKSIGYYNTCYENETYIKKVANKFRDAGIVLFITYGQDYIEDIYIGSDVKVNDNYNVEYCMKIHLNRDNDERVIDSIIDKIDLDITKDFEPNCYMIVSDMDSLYNELRIRINAKIESKEENLVSAHTKSYRDELYQLSPLAQKDIHAIRIYNNGELGIGRTEFQRDRERIVNCKAFRRLVDKAQIFSAEKGDYFRTRMTHTLEVNQIAKAISYALNLNLDLTEAIALAHDLGHTPYGHQGERTLDDILRGKTDIEFHISKKILEIPCFGGFKHNYQSARILTQIEEKYTQFPGLNVSVQVVEGVLKHTRLKKNIVLEEFLTKEYLDNIVISKDEEKNLCATLEGQVVAIADEIAQRGHDVDDALTSGVISIDEFIDRLKINKCNQLHKTIKDEINSISETERVLTDAQELKVARIVSVIINYMIQTTIEHSKKQINKYKNAGPITPDNSDEIIALAPSVERINSYLERVVQKKVICNYDVARADYNAGMIVKKLFEKYYANPRLLHSGTIQKIFNETLKNKNVFVSNSAINLNDGSIKIVNKEIEEMTKKELNEKKISEYLLNKRYNPDDKDIIVFEKRKILVKAITDYIAGMTDGYALEEYKKLM